MTATQVQITSQEHIWEILRQFATNEKDPDDVRLSFENFPRIVVKFEGPHFDAALPVRSMEALKAIQSEIYRLYALAVHNDESYSLSKEVKEDLELFFQVREGSSDTEPLNLEEVLKRIIDKAAEKMEPRHYIVIVGIVVAGWTAPEIIKKYSDSKTEQVRVAVEAQTEQVRQTEETRRLEIVERIATINPAVQKAIESQDRTIEAIAKSVKGIEKAVLPGGMELNEQIAKELYPRNKRRSVEEIRMDGIYTVKVFEVNNGDAKLKIEDAGGREYHATASVSDQGLLERIALAVARQETINLKINARDLEGEKRDLVVVGAETIVVAGPTAP